MKLWQKRKKSQTPQPGIEPGTPANAADALPLSHRDKRYLPFPSSSFPFLSLSFSLRPFVCAKKRIFAFTPITVFPDQGIKVWFDCLQSKDSKDTSFLLLGASRQDRSSRIYPLNLVESSPIGWRTIFRWENCNILIKR